MSERKATHAYRPRFHVLNVLQTGGKVTGLLDWGGFAIADPAYDVANTLVLITIPPKHLAGSLGLAQTDWHRVAELYLAAYRSHRFLEDTNLDYYRARRCVLGLVQGVEGQKVWQHPLIVQDLITTIFAITGIRITVPGLKPTTGERVLWRRDGVTSPTRHETDAKLHHVAGRRPAASLPRLNTPAGPLSPAPDPPAP